MTFVRRKIDLTFELGQGSFDESGATKVTVSDLQVSFSAVNAGLPSSASADIRVWGLTPSLMNTLSRLGKPIGYERVNTVTVMAGDDTSGMSQVYFGTMLSSYGDFSDAANPCLNIHAQAAAVDLVKPVPPVSIKGPVDVVTVITQIAASMNKGVRNSGVSGVKLPTTYLTGSAMEQLQKVVTAADIMCDPSSGPDGKLVEIWPKGKAKQGVAGASVPVISADTGMVGYPTYSDFGIAVKSLFFPGFSQGGEFQIKMAPNGPMDAVNGSWVVYGIGYDLESETRTGKWFMDIVGQRPSDAGVTQ